jgi:hypothetical protein
MGEVIHSARGQKLSPSLIWQPWMKSSIVPPWRRGMKPSLVPVALLQKDGKTSPSQIGMPVCSAALLLIYSSVFKRFQLVTCLLTLPCSFACAASVKTPWRTSRRWNKLSTPRSKQLNLELHSRRFRSYPNTSLHTWRACLP